MSVERVKVAIVNASADATPLVSALGDSVCDTATDPAQGLRAARQHGARWIAIDASILATVLDECATLRAELAKARAELEDRKLVERAKGLLMTRRGLTEPDAYRTLQKLAMDRKRKLADIARNVLDFAELLGGPNDPTR